MGLKEYVAKRSFEVTPEPSDTPAKPDKKTLRFVVQKHDASHLHYDFRLENNGVLVSWAVPKGPSLNPADKRLAMMTEDHPYDYQYFEGVIPQGNYGAGQVIVWDNGTFEVEPGKSKPDQEKSFRRQLHAGKIVFTLHGHKLHGEFTLVKTKKPNGKGNEWLLIKHKDDQIKDADITKEDKSVISGIGVEEVNESDNFNWNQCRDCIEQYDLPKRDIKRPVAPMLATLVDQAFSDKDWLYEVKWDGYRAIAEANDGDVKLYSRNGKSFNDKYPTVAQALQKLHTDAVVDGEVVVLDKDSRPSFNDLQNYDSKKDPSPVYYVFDLLWLKGYDLTDAPLTLRKKLLRMILPTSNILRYSDHVMERGEDMLAAAVEQQLEGVMAKRADGTYHPGKRSKDWLKFKTGKRQETVIGGFTEPRGSRKGLGALILGVYDGDKLRYVGHSGGGIPDKQLVELRKQLEKTERKTSPFVEEPKPNAPVHWVKPEMLCEVSFTEWTPEGHMRHPKIIGIRTDKPAKKVIHEEPEQTEKIVRPKTSTPTTEFEISHEDKVFWPKLGLTKGDLVKYYQTISEYMMPYLQDRPMSLLRHPHGVDGPSFFQKDMQSVPKGMRTFRRYSESNKKDINYFVTTDEQALLYMVQLGCIEINPWNSTTKHPDNPDWLVLDLDPEDIGFDQVVKVALHIKDFLDGLDVPSFVKTSGKTGIHIYLPLHAKYDYDQCRQFAEILARTIQPQLPDITSVERSPSKRQGKIYLDFLQNRMGQTLAAPYSVRPTAEASVSMPLEWYQITSKLRPSDFTLQNAPDIVKNRKDPWEKFWDTQVRIEDVLPKLGGDND